MVALLAGLHRAPSVAPERRAARPCCRSAQFLSDSPCGSTRLADRALLLRIAGRILPNALPGVTGSRFLALRPGREAQIASCAPVERIRHIRRRRDQVV